MPKRVNTRVSAFRRCVPPHEHKRKSTQGTPGKDTTAHRIFFYNIDRYSKSQRTNLVLPIRARSTWQVRWPQCWPSRRWSSCHAGQLSNRVGIGFPLNRGLKLLLPNQCIETIGDAPLLDIFSTAKNFRKSDIFFYGTRLSLWLFSVLQKSFLRICEPIGVCHVVLLGGDARTKRCNVAHTKPAICDKEWSSRPTLRAWYEDEAFV